ncbi:MAG: hypothetical protein R3D29_00175 [Nitratireductor sp.]
MKREMSPWSGRSNWQKSLTLSIRIMLRRVDIVSILPRAGNASAAPFRAGASGAIGVAARLAVRMEFASLAMAVISLATMICAVGLMFRTNR